MKQTSAKINLKTVLYLVILVLFFSISNTFAQPNSKFAQAQKAYLEGKNLSNQESIEAYEKALVKFQTAKRLYKELGDENNEGKTLLETGLMLSKLGSIADALEEYKAAYQLFDKLKNRIPQAQSANYIGVIYSMLGQKKLAFELYNHALRIFYEADAFGEAIQTINNIGSMYQDFGDKKNALFYFELALPYVREVRDKDREGMILKNLGGYYLKFGEPEKALNYYKQALEIFKQTGFESGKVQALNSIGVNTFRIGKKQESIEYLNQALKINRSRFKNYEALTLQNLLSVWKELDNKQLAVFYGKQAVNKYQEIRRSIRTLDPKVQTYYLSTIENAYRQLAELLIEQGDFARAEQVLRMLKEEEYFDFVRRDSGESKNLEQRVKLTEKEEKLLKRYADLANQLSETEREFETLDKRKNRLSPIEQKRFEEVKAQLADANAAFKLFLEKELVVEFGKAKTEGIEYDRSFQAKLRKWGEGTVTLYTVVTENRYRVILTTPNLQVDGKTEISALELNKKIFAYRNALQDITADPRPLGKELYDILIKPIEKDLQEANAKTLVWSLDGTLRYIPISTLSPDGKTYLVEKYRNVITTPNTRNDLTDSDTEWRALGVGVSESQSVTDPENPNEKIDFSPIPGTKEELMTIVRDEETPNEKGILNGRRFLDKDFTINSLTESLTTTNSNGKGKFTAVHIASHFQLGSNWANSFLLLGNGQILTLKELKTSPKLNFGDVELVTLSACDTAFTADSNGKEVDSLAEVIQAKSGKAVLAALWAVVDESTPLLMSEFYRLRKENPKMTKAEAMQTVQKAFVTGKLKPSAEYIKKLDDYYKELNAEDKTFKFDKNAPFAHPYFWSPFVLIGNWR
jgi:CHAT domain-containing protein